jgi:hypothetical protein
MFTFLLLSTALIAKDEELDWIPRIALILLWIWLDIFSICNYELLSNIYNLLTK